MKKKGQPGGLENRRPVEIHIDALILDGFDPGERDRINDAMQKELGRLIRKEGAPESTGITLPIKSLDAGTIKILPGSTARATGARIAAAVYRGLCQQGRHAPGERFAQPASGGHPR